MKNIFWIYIGLISMLSHFITAQPKISTNENNNILKKKETSNRKINTVSIVIICEMEYQFTIKRWMSQFASNWQKSNHLTVHKIVIIGLQQLYEESTKLTKVQICKTIKENGISLVIDATIGGYVAIENLQKELKLPYIQISITKFPLVNSVIEYVKQKFGNSYAIIFQNQKEEEMGLYCMLAYTNIRVIVLNQLQKRSIKRLRTLNPQPEFYAIAANTENMNNLFEIAIKSKLIRRNNYDRWILLFLDFESKMFKYENDDHPQIAKLIPNKNLCCEWMKMNKTCTCPKYFELEEQFFKRVMQIVLSVLREQSYPATNITCDSATPVLKADAPWYDDILRELEKDKRIKRKDYYFFEYHVDVAIHVARNDNLAENVLAGHYYNETIKLIDEYKPLKSVKQYYRIGTTPSVPWFYQKRDPKTNKLVYDENNNIIWEGYCMDLIESIAKIMKFDYEILLPESGTYGKKVNNKWDGLIGDLQRGRTNISVASLKMTADREGVVDFIAPYFEQTGISIIMRKPIQDKSIFKFLTVLRLEVWLGIFGALISTAIMIWILDRFSPYSAQNNGDLDENQSHTFTLKESLWFAIKSFTPQGGGDPPMALSGRILVAAYWLFVILMLATFTANLAAYLTLERMQTPVSSLDQLIRQNRINYTVVENSDTHEFFKNMKHAEDTIFRKWKELTLNTSNSDSNFRVWDYPVKEEYGYILKSIQETGFMISAHEGFMKVNETLTADFAFIHDSAEINYELSRYCEFTEVGERFAVQPYAVAVQQGSNIQDDVSRAIIHLQKERFFEKMRIKYWNTSVRGECFGYDDTKGISLQSLSGVFIAALFGLILSIMILIGEIYYHNKKIKMIIKLKYLKHSFIGHKILNRMKK